MANKTTAQLNLDVYLVNYKLKTFFLSMANSYCSIPVNSFKFILHAVVQTFKESYVQ